VIFGSAAALEGLDDDHAAAAAGTLVLCWLRFCGLRLFIGAADGFDCIDGNERRREQLAGTGDVLGTLAAGEQAIVAAKKDCLPFD
jgi:hypothetical protein